MQFNNTKYAYVHNLQGDIVGIIDSTGTEVVKYIYDAWGKVLSTTGSLASTLGTVQPFRYRGYVYDVETGLYYLRSRYYKPIYGRFINSDRYFSGNVFAYCKNNYSSQIDPDGLHSFAIAGPRVNKEYDKLEGEGISGGSGGAFLVGFSFGFIVSIVETIVSLFTRSTDTTSVSQTQSSSIQTGAYDANKGLTIIAKSYEIGKCDSAAYEMERQYPGGAIIKLWFPYAYNGYIVTDRTGNEAISSSGKHFGYEYNGWVHCIIFPEGYPLNTWVKLFHADVEIKRVFRITNGIDQEVYLDASEIYH